MLCWVFTTGRWSHSGPTAGLASLVRLRGAAAVWSGLQSQCAVVWSDRLKCWGKGLTPAAAPISQLVFHFHEIDLKSICWRKASFISETNRYLSPMQKSLCFLVLKFGLVRKICTELWFSILRTRARMCKRHNRQTFSWGHECTGTGYLPLCQNVRCMEIVKMIIINKCEKLLEHGDILIVNSTQHNTVQMKENPEWHFSVLLSLQKDKSKKRWKFQQGLL